MIINTASELLQISFKTVIFDVDGVLVDVYGSFRKMISEAARVYLEKTIKHELDFEPLPDELVQVFKNHGGFNNDWELTRAAVLIYLDHWSKNGISQLSPEEIKSYLEKAGSLSPGIKGVEELINDKRYSPAEIEHLCMSLYAGSKTEEIYGVKKHPDAPDRGFYLNEEVLIDESLLSDELIYGIITGRTAGELALFFERVPRLKQLVGNNYVCDDGSHLARKPDPEVISHLKRVVPPAIFIGDTVDDIHTAKNFKDYRIYSGAVAHTPELFRLFRSLKADIIAENINDLLLFITRSGEKVEKSQNQ